MQCDSKTFHSTTNTFTENMEQPTTSFRTTTPSTATTGRMITKQVHPVQVPQDTPHKTHLESCMHVHQPVSQVCKPGELLALRKVKHLLNGRTSVSRLPLTKQDILSQYSSCFEGIGCFPGDLYKFHLKPEHKPAQHAPRKVPIHLETAFKEEIESLVKQGILEEVNNEITAKLQGMTVFTIVEFKKGYWMVVLHPDSRKLTCMALPFGRFQWT